MLPISRDVTKTGVELLHNMISIQVDTRRMNDIVDNIDQVGGQEEEPSKEKHHGDVMGFQVVIHAIDINDVHREPGIHV